MNKQKLLEKAESLLDERRCYDKRYHAVNVKRYNDRIDEAKISKLITSDFKNEVMEAINSSEEYFFWLNTEWEQLNYELSNLHNIFNKGDKWFHDRFQFITLPVLSLGRSGGWACRHAKGIIFDSELENITENFEDYELEDLKNCIEEVEFVAAFIDEFNRQLSYQDYIENNLDSIIERIERHHNKIAKAAILPLTTSKNEQIKRHAKGIIKEFEKLSL